MFLTIIRMNIAIVVFLMPKLIVLIVLILLILLMIVFHILDFLVLTEGHTTPTAGGTEVVNVVTLYVQVLQIVAS